jgi:hypothetical protein
MMTKAELKTGMLLSTTKDKKYIVYMDTVFGDIAVCVDGINQERLDLWDDDLMATGCHNQDIQWVGTPTTHCLNMNHFMRPTQFDKLASLDTHRVLWCRKLEFEKGDYVVHPDHSNMAFRISGETSVASTGDTMWEVEKELHHSWVLHASTGFKLWSLVNAHPADLVMVETPEYMGIRIIPARLAQCASPKYKKVVPYIGQEIGQNCGNPIL